MVNDHRQWQQKLTAWQSNATVNPGFPQQKRAALQRSAQVFSSAPTSNSKGLDDSLENNIAMLQAIGQGWLTTDESINSYFEKNILAYLVGYLKDNDLISPSEEHERLLINLKTVLGAYSNARRITNPNH